MRPDKKLSKKARNQIRDQQAWWDAHEAQKRVEESKKSKASKPV